MGKCTSGEGVRHNMELPKDPGWPRPYLPRPLPTATEVVSRLVEQLENGTPHLLAQGNERNDGKTVRATGGQGLVWRTECDQGRQVAAVQGQKGNKEWRKEKGERGKEKEEREKGRTRKKLRGGQASWL